MERAPVLTKLTKPNAYLSYVFLCLMIAILLGAVLFVDIRQAFLHNPFLNGLILFVLIVGILYIIGQILRLYPEIRWVNNFRIADPGLSMGRQPKLLAPMATMLRDRKGQFSISSASMRSILDSVGARLDEARDTSRYLIGLLVFLGLLGTFWGLLQTIQSVGVAIGSLSTGASDSLTMLQDLLDGLKAPLNGMGTAFSSSLFGLTGSLILGLLDLQSSQAQNRFYTELEDWLSHMTELQSGEMGGENSPGQLRYAIMDMQRSLEDFGDKIQISLENSSADESVKELARGIEKLVKQMRAEQKVVREWVDEQAAHQSELAAVLREFSARTSAKR